jgi:DNA-binding NtrC family response regulator
MKKQLNILVVDDEPLVGKSLKRLLGKAGYNVEAFTDSLAAVEELDKQHFDIIITDLMMDGLDGLEVLEIAKEKYPDIKVIIITGYAQKLSAEEAAEKGAFAFVEKPFRIEQIKKIIREAEMEILDNM